MSDQQASILVVDDDEAARYAVVRALKAEGHDIMEASTGRQSLELARSACPDLIVLDVRLPDMLGFDVTEQLKNDPATRAIAILQISASYTAADAQAHGLRRGADAYLVRPVEPAVLCATAHSLLRMRRAELREKQAREQAEASESRYRFLADMLPQMVWTCDAHGQIEYVNRRWVEFTGLGIEQLAGRSDWTDSMHPDDREKFSAAWARSLQSGTPLEVESRRWSRPMGAFRWLLIRATPMRDQDGSVIRWFGTSTDIEAQKQALAERERLLHEAELLSAERASLVAELRAEARRKNEFLAVLSHELRNPLAPIRNSVYILDRAVPGGEQAKRARDVINRQTQQLTRLVDDLLDVTRIAHGKIRLQRESVELNGLVRRSAEDHRELFERAGIELAVDIWDRPLMVHADPARLAQVVGNLLQNAAKFTPQGGRATLTLRLERADVAAISVRDTGAGIEQDTLGHLFEPFTQGEKTLDRSRGGLGLGLALAKGVVELHGGSISVRSDGANRGSEFTVTLPLDRRGGARLSIVPRDGRIGQPRRVLVVEDNHDAAQTLREVLQLSHHEVEVAYSVPQGLAAARSFEPDVVLCDIGLPLVDGFEFARHMRRDPKLRSVFLVAVSGYSSQEDAEKSKEAGFDQHVAKPVSLETIERLIAEAPARAAAS